MSRSSLSRARRVLGVLGSVVGVTVTFVAGVAGGALLHLDTPGVRRLARGHLDPIALDRYEHDGVWRYVQHIPKVNVLELKRLEA